MKTSPGSDGRARYGAIELKESLQLYWMMGLGLAIAVHLGIVASYRLAEGTGGEAFPGPIVREGHISMLPLPAPINPWAPQPINVAEHGFKNSVGTPVPVPEPVADPEQTLAPQALFNPTGPVDGEVEGGGGTGEPINIPESAPPPFRSVEEMPKIIHSVPPVYPDIALRANLEGTVLVKLWVDRDGKPRDISVEESSEEIFNDAAIAAAHQLLFRPAYMNSGPVAVWLRIPFRFRLADRR